MDQPQYNHDLEHALWFNVMCKCEYCDRADFFDEFDELADSSPIKWAQTVTPIAQAAGWTTPDTLMLVCRDCAAKRCHS
jgi:hypothetical protein